MIYVIALIESYNAKLNTKKPKGIRVFSSDTLSSRDIKIKDFMLAIARGVKVENVCFNGDNIEGIGFLMKDLPSCYKYRGSWSVENSYNRVLVRHGDIGAADEYLYVYNDGTYSKVSSEEVYDVINRGYILNREEYVQRDDETHFREAILKVLKGCGCTDIGLSLTRELNYIKVPDGCDLVLPATIDKLGTIYSDTGYIKSITFLSGSNKEDKFGCKPMYLNTRDGYSSICLNNGTIKCGSGNGVVVDKITACDAYSAKSISCSIDFKCKEIVLDYDIASQIRGTISRFKLYGQAGITRAICDGELKVTVAEHNKVRLGDIDDIQSAFRGYYSLNNTFSTATDIVDKIGIGGMSKRQQGALRFLEVIKYIMREDTKKTIEDWMKGFNHDIKEVLEDMCISKYPTYGGICIQRERKIIKCSKERLTKKERNGGYAKTEATFVDTRDCIKTREYINNMSEINYTIGELSSRSNLVLLGINKSVKDDVVYGVIELKLDPKDKDGDNMVYKSLYNMSVVDVISRLDKEPGMHKGYIQRHGGYILVTSMGDIVAFEESKIEELIEQNQSKQVGRLISINNMLDRECDYDITDLGIITKYNVGNTKIVRLPNGTKEVGFKAIETTGTIKELIIPSLVKPLTKDRFYFDDNYIQNMVVHDRFNVESGLILGAEWSDGYGVSKIVYNVDSQKEMMRLFIKVWNKSYFLKYKGVIEVTEQLDMEHTKKLMATVMNKSGFTEYIQESDSNERYRLQLENELKIRQFKLFLQKVRIYVDEEVYRIVMNIAYNH